jgi:hypothetical protein
MSILGDIACVVPPAEGHFDLSGYDNVVDAVVGIITRHPMREDELLKALSRWSSADVNATLRKLENSGKAQVIERYGCRFWSATAAHYPEQTKR